MDFFERWFGLSPDNGDGSTELLYVCAVVLIVAAIALWVRQSRSRRHLRR